jgi:hypothetical protein
MLYDVRADRLAVTTSISCGPGPATYDCRGWNRPATRIEHLTTLSSAVQSDMTKIEALFHVTGTSANCTAARSLIFHESPRAYVNLGLARRTSISKARFITHTNLSQKDLGHVPCSSMTPNRAYHGIERLQDRFIECHRQRLDYNARC